MKYVATVMLVLFFSNAQAHGHKNATKNASSLDKYGRELVKEKVEVNLNINTEYVCTLQYAEINKSGVSVTQVVSNSGTFKCPKGSILLKKVK